MNNSEYFSSINDVSVQLNVPAHTLRYWEKQFPVAIRPTTGAGGRRYYRAETVARLRVIRDLLYDHGMTIAGVKKLLRDGNLPENAADLMARGDAAAELRVAADASTTAVVGAAIDLLQEAKKLLV
ncbi:MerR family transcriptional regulator [bacterium]|nr:MerR family transcriptional regulator [bacterium]